MKKTIIAISFFLTLIGPVVASALYLSHDQAVKKRNLTLEQTWGNHYPAQLSQVIIDPSMGF